MTRWVPARCHKSFLFNRYYLEYINVVPSDSKLQPLCSSQSVFKCVIYGIRERTLSLSFCMNEDRMWCIGLEIPTYGICNSNLVPRETYYIQLVYFHTRRRLIEMLDISVTIYPTSQFLKVCEMYYIYWMWKGTECGSVKGQTFECRSVLTDAQNFPSELFTWNEIR